MPHFAIVTPDQTEPVSELIASDPGSVLNIMFQLGCRDADVLRDGAYSFPARLDANEVWSIFDRHRRGREPYTVPASTVLALSLPLIDRNSRSEPWLVVQ